jgi:hypothetical protein
MCGSDEFHARVGSGHFATISAVSSDAAVVDHNQLGVAAERSNSSGCR